MPLLLIPAVLFFGAFVGSQVDDAIDTNTYNPPNKETIDIFSTTFLIKSALSVGVAWYAHKLYKKFA